MAKPDTGRPFVVSAAPHTTGTSSIENVMLQVILALLPALAWSVYTFGVGALRVTALAVVACMVFDELAARVLGNQGSWKDLSAAVTGLLLALNLSASTPWWLVIVGAAVAMILGKQLFGGLGHNPFNPAILARVVLLISFPAQLSSWPKPEAVWNPMVDAVTAATPLGALKADGLQAAMANSSWLDLLLGQVGGCLGEVSAVALLLGAAYLMIRKIIRWPIPVAFLATVAAGAALHQLLGTEALPVQYHLLSGGLFLGAFFMATDYVTSPMSLRGQLIFGVGCGLVTMVIRIFGSYPEGVSFAILLMNGLVPLIDRYTRPRRFGALGVSHG